MEHGHGAGGGPRGGPGGRGCHARPRHDGSSTAKNREQFDKPLGAIQAISQYLADAKTNLDGARVLVHEAVWASDEGRDLGSLDPMAKLQACDTYRDITAMAQQVFGGIGFTVDHDIQLCFRRAKQLRLSWWDTR